MGQVKIIALIIIVEMLMRKMNNVRGERARVGSVGVDPHGELVCLYEQERCQFIVVEVASIFKYFEHYRMAYFQHNCYDNKESLPSLITFKSQQILQGFPNVQMSIKLGDNQFTIIYFCTFIEIIKVNVVHWQVVFRALYKLASEILEVNTLDQNIYVSLYDGSMIHIGLKDIQSKKKSEVCHKIVQVSQNIKREHLPMLESLRIDQDLEQGYKIWQTYSGKLMLNNKVLSNEFEDNFDYSNSFQEYLGKEISEKHPVKYYMSLCRQYIIGSSFGKIDSPCNHFTLKARWCAWAQIAQLSIKPQINQYWKSYQNYMANEQNWGFRKSSASTTPSKKSYLCDKLLICYYCPRQNVLKISWLIINKFGRKRSVSQGQSYERKKYKSQEKAIMQVKNLKHPIVQIKWIGLNQMLCIDKSFNLYFLQFDQQQLVQ